MPVHRDIASYLICYIFWKKRGGSENAFLLYLSMQLLQSNITMY